MVSSASLLSSKLTSLTTGISPTFSGCCSICKSTIVVGTDIRDTWSDASFTSTRQSTSTRRGRERRWVIAVGPDTAAQTRLAEIAERTPVTLTLKSGIAIHTTLSTPTL